MGFSPSDTIVAIATPPGRGGIGVVRISGPNAQPVVRGLIAYRGELEPRRATLTTIRSGGQISSDSQPGCPHGDAIDRAVVTFFPAPHSYTSEDVVEISAHGSPVVLRYIVESAVALGARLAERGEFTFRAFLNGRLDLIEAESVADLVDAVTPLQARAAFDQLEGTLTRTIAEIDADLYDLIARLEASVDFPEEGYHFVTPPEIAKVLDRLVARTGQLVDDARRGRMIREGFQVAIVGRPNVGKSSLFNALVGSARAIVTDTPGTTRDLVTEVIDLAGLRITLIDTAGVRAPGDAAEAEGVERARRAWQVADLALVVVDEDEPDGDLIGSDEPERSGSSSGPGCAKYFVVQSKIDLGRPDRGVRVSARTGEGLGHLKDAIVHALDFDLQRDRPEITNVRHAALVERAHRALIRARLAADSDNAMPEEFVLVDLQEARAVLEEVTGRRAPDELLTHIFSRFCVGK